MNLKKNLFLCPNGDLVYKREKKTEGAIKNGQSRNTGNNGYTRHRTNTHDTGRIHKTPDEYTRHRTNTQDIGRIDKTTQHSKLKI